jgi:hypothetical protein
MYWRSQHGGEPDLLDQHEMQRVIEKFRTYGTEDAADAELAHAGDRLPA